MPGAQVIVAQFNQAFIPGHPHSWFLEVFLETGALGLFALVTSLFVVGADDMAGQYGDPNNGAGEAIPNYHEGWGRIDLGGSINSSFVDGETVNTGEFREFAFNVPASLSTLKVALSYTDTMGDPALSVQLNNDLDIELFKPDGTSVPLGNNLDTTKGIIINSPQSGTWEVHVTGTNVPIGPQPFAIAVNVDSGLSSSERTSSTFAKAASVTSKVSMSRSST